MKITAIKLFFCAAALSTIPACGTQQLTKTEKTKMDQTENKSENAIFPKGEKAPADNFTGNAWIQPLVKKDENINYVVGSVTFEPGARTFWHTHPAGQVLLVTEGKGLYQEKGNPIKTISKGDAIVCNPDIEHWHGSAPGSRMTHVAITNYKGDSNVKWLKPVTDEEYGAKME